MHGNDCIYCRTPALHSALGNGRRGHFPFDELELEDYPFTAQCSMRPTQDTYASLWANEIHYQKSSGGQITLARAKGTWNAPRKLSQLL